MAALPKGALLFSLILEDREPKMAWALWGRKTYPAQRLTISPMAAMGLRNEQMLQTIRNSSVTGPQGRLVESYREWLSSHPSSAPY